MAITIKKAMPDPDQPQEGSLVADRRLWLNAGGTRIVEDGDPAAAFLLAAPGRSIPKSEVDRLGLELVDGAIQHAGARKRAARPEDKKAKPAADKARGAAPPASK